MTREGRLALLKRASFNRAYFTNPNRAIDARMIEPGYSRPRVNSFIYVDGAFRYVGDACPFWGGAQCPWIGNFFWRSRASVTDMENSKA